MADQETESFIWWRDPPLFTVLFLLAFVSGLHIAIAAEAVRKWTRVPYLLAMAFFYATLLVPLWMPGFKFYFWPSLIGSALTMICLILPVVIRGRDEIMDGGIFEASTPAHLILMMTYLLPIYFLP